MESGGPSKGRRFHSLNGFAIQSGIQPGCSIRYVLPMHIAPFGQNGFCASKNTIVPTTPNTIPYNIILALSHIAFSPHIATGISIVAMPRDLLFR